MSTSTRMAPPVLLPHQQAPTSEQLRSAAFFVQNQWYSRQYPPTFPARPEDVRDGIVKPLRACAWSRTGKHIAVGKELKEIKVFEGGRVPLDVNNAVPLSMQPHNGHISTLAFSPVDEDILVSGCRSAPSGGRVVVWNVTSGSAWDHLYFEKLMAEPQDPIAAFTLGDIMSISFHPSGRQFIASHSRSGRDEVTSFHLVQDGETEVWKEREDITLTSRSGAPYDEMNGIQFINSGKAICGVSNDGTFSAWQFPLDPVPLSPQHVVLEVDEEMEDDDAEEASRKSTPREGSPDPENDEPELAPAAKEGAGEEADSAKDTAPGATDEAEVDKKDDDTGKGENEVVEEENVKADAKDIDEEGTVDEEKADGEEAALKPAEDKPEESGAANGTGTKENSAVDTVDTAGDGEMAVAPVDADVEMGETATNDEAETDAPAPDAEAGPSEAMMDADASQPEANGDVDMADPVSETAAPSVAPSRHPSPPPEKPKKRKLEAPKTKAKQLTRVRRTFCSASSLQTVGLDPTGRFVAVAGFDSVVRLLDSRDWICQRTFNQSLGGIKHLSFSRDGELLAFGGDDQSVYIVSVISGELVIKYDSRAVINSLHWHPNKNWLAWTTSNKGTANLTAPLWIARVEP